MLIAARNAFRSTGANRLAPLDLSVLASTYAALGKFGGERNMSCFSKARYSICHTAIQDATSSTDAQPASIGILDEIVSTPA